MTDREKVLDWLRSIGEKDPATIAAVLRHNQRLSACFIALITSRLPACWLSGMASWFTSRMASRFISDLPACWHSQMATQCETDSAARAYFVWRAGGGE